VIPLPQPDGSQGRHRSRSYCRPARFCPYERTECGLSSVEIATHGVPVEACRLKLAHDHADVLLAEVLFAVTGNRDDDAGFMAKAPMARRLAAQFGKAVIG
jgi:hypothetical protein